MKRNDYDYLLSSFVISFYKSSQQSITCDSILQRLSKLNVISCFNSLSHFNVDDSFKCNFIKQF